MPRKSGLQWAAMRRLPRNYTLAKIAIQERSSMGCNGKTFEELLLTKIAMYESAAMGCNGKTFEELPS